MTYKNLHLPTLLLLFFVIFSSCSKEGPRRLPRHSGEPGEVLVVMDENLWLGAPGDSLRSYFESYYPLLPQSEPSFSLLHFTPDEMSTLLRRHRNILRVEIGNESNGKKKLSLAEDKWSNEQLFFTLIAPNQEAYYEMIPTELPKVISLINDKEVERIQQFYSRNGNDDLEMKLKRVYGLDIHIPADFKVAKSENGFTWLKRERIKYIGNTAHEITQGLFFYRYPYQSDSAFTQKAILSERDSVLKKNVPGPKEGTYMTTEYLFPPRSKAINLNGKYSVLTRGLWKTENYFMGGPFMSLTTTSTNDKNIICVSGFVFAPKFDKREYIREIEAMLRSVKVVSSDSLKS